MNNRTRVAAFLSTLALAGAAVTASTAGAATPGISFKMVQSGTAAAAGCLKNAHASVSIVSSGAVETMKIDATGLPKNTDFDLFVIQVPNAPFGLSWYQGDLESDSTGAAHGTFVGRFSFETFTVAPGVAPAPVVHHHLPFPDASQNPATGPVHQYHLGLWFNSEVDAANAGCPATVTPFNGRHHAGVQALSTRNFTDANGPLRQLQ
jgi:hypothetical protein